MGEIPNMITRVTSQSIEILEQMDRDGYIYWSKNNRPGRKYYMVEY